MACGTLQENLNSIPPFEAKFSRLELPFCFAINGYISYTYLIILLHTDPEVCPREFWTTSNNGKDFMFNYVATVLTRTCCFYISYNQNMSLLHIIINHTVIRVS